jgi:excisionase family DNA binding protein
MKHDGDFPDEQLLLTTVQAARVLGVSRTTVYQLIKNGELRPLHLARCCRISWAELERFVMRLESVHTEPSVPDDAPARTQRRWRRAVTHTGQRSLFAVEAPAQHDEPAS